jgi:hypothetical protein
VSGSGTGAASRLPRASYAAALALVVAGAALALAAGTGFGALTAFLLAYVVVSGAVGALVASRQPRNAIGWILSALALWAGISALARGAAEYMLAADGASDAWGERAAWVASWSFVPFLFVPATFLLLLFPDGQLPSRGFRPIAWAAGAVIAFWVFTVAVDRGPLEAFESVTNPYGIDAPALSLASDLVAPVMLVCVLASAASVVARARRATATERQQMKWLAFAGCFAVAMLIFGAVIYDNPFNALSGIALLSLPVAIGVAVLRYGLYEIDFVINRTLVYVPLIAIIGGISTALVPVSHRVSEALTGTTSDASIVIATLLIAAIVAPIRKRLEGVVEGRFKGRPSARGDGNAILEDPEFVARVESIAKRAAREAVEEAARRERADG